MLERYFPDDRFEALKKPLYISATDIEDGRSQIFSSGPLVRPVLASAAYPMVFTPLLINGVMYADGGIMNNFPAEPLTDQCEHLIGVYVNPVPLQKMAAKSLKSGLAVAERAYHLSMAKDVAHKLEQCTFQIWPEPLAQYDTFDLMKASEIFEVGYKAGKKALKNYLKQN